MRYRCLGQSGLRVAELALGTMTFGNKLGWGADKAESRRIFDAYAAAGGNFVDTANVYAEGASEEFVGEFVAAERHRFVVATKYTMSRPSGDPNGAGNQRKNLVQALEASLRRLKLEYVDLYWIHAWDFLTPVAEIMRSLDDQVRAGKILYAGVSNAPAWTTAQANTLAALRGWSPFVALQIEYSLVQRAPERELLPMARALGIGVTAWSPLGAGVLTGKYGQTPAGQEARRLDITPAERLSDRNLALAGAVQSTAQRLGRSPAQVALAWVRQRGVIPILGARTQAQVGDALASLELVLPADELERLNAASAVDLGYPHDFLARENIKGSVYCGTYGQIDSQQL
jgi:aryl-alcohol dehydrogenase-like predicted oxidoreductase